MATDIVARGIAANKLDKSGGTIDGNLSVTGDLHVNGTTVTTKQETLLIKKNMIVTNADGLPLSGLSGIGIRNGQSDVYGLVYDNSSSAVKFGIGTLDSNNNFTFNSGEGLPIAIRDDATLFSNGHFVKWDSSGNKFVDGGDFDVSNFVDVSSNQSVGGIKTFTSNVVIGANISDGNNSYAMPNSSGILALESQIPVLDQFMSNDSTGHGITNKGLYNAVSSLFGVQDGDYFQNGTTIYINTDMPIEVVVDMLSHLDLTESVDVGGTDVYCSAILYEDNTNGTQGVYMADLSTLGGTGYIIFTAKAREDTAFEFEDVLFISDVSDPTNEVLIQEFFPSFVMPGSAGWVKTSFITSTYVNAVIVLRDQQQYVYDAYETIISCLFSMDKRMWKLVKCMIDYSVDLVLNTPV